MSHKANNESEINKNALLTDAGIYRFSKSRLPKDYVDYQDVAGQSEPRRNAPKMVGWQEIDHDELVSEFMLNALRLHGGVDWSLFQDRTGLKLDDIAPSIDKLVAQGLLTDSVERLQPTPLGQRYLNQILRAFL